ncbi:MAG: YlcI/YnfO family protein [Gaiella sp.]
MEIETHVRAIQSELAAAAALGGDDLAEAGRRLSDAVGSSVHLHLLDVLSEAALTLSAQLGEGRVELRLAGREPELVVVQDDVADAVVPVAADDASARLTLRLPDAVKTAIEAEAAREGVSTNAWIVRALRRSLEPRTPQRKSGNRLQGFARS